MFLVAGIFYMKNAWEKYDDNGIKEIFDFNEGYKNFISHRR